MPKNFIDPIFELNTSICVPDPKIKTFYMPILREAPTWRCPWHVQVVLPILPKMPNLMLIVYLPKIFSSVAGLFPLDPLNLLSAGTVLTWLSPVSGVSQVCSCVYLSRDHYNEKHAKIYRYGVLCHFAKHTVSIKAGSWSAKKFNCCQIHSFDATKMACPKK